MAIHPLLPAVDMDEFVDGSSRGHWFPWFQCHIFILDAQTTGLHADCYLLKPDDPHPSTSLMPKLALDSTYSS
jgi:hypothetical protein